MSYGGGFDRRGGGGGGGGGHSSVMKVDSGSVGKIIGRAGSNIKSLEQQTNARIKVGREEDDNGKKEIEISGDPDAVQMARDLIDECLNSGPGDFQGGRQGGGGYGGRDRGSGGFGRRDDGGGRYGRRDDGDRWGRQDRDDYGGDRGQRRQNNYGGESGGEQETIYVDSSEVGRIIGRGGTRIRDMEDSSGCRIKVSRDGDSNGRSSVDLSGSKGQISKAKQLIQDAGVDIGEDSGRGFTQGNSFKESFNGSSNHTHSAGRNGFQVNENDNEDEDRPPPRPRIDWNNLRQQAEEYKTQRFAHLPPIIKDFYEEADHITHMPSEEAKRIRRENNNIIVDSPDGPETVPNPVRSFEDAFEPFPLILEQIYKQNFVKPSPIQCQAWPILLKGKDLIGIAQTGTGKTMAFLLPALIHIDNQPVPRHERTGPSALVLSPTRELAQQIEQEVNKINYKGIRSICVYGGGDRRAQLKRCKEGVEIVVATPGRLNDFMMNGIIDVTNVTYLVMDEADRMLDMGFEVEIKKVMLDIRPDRQTVMTSATWPPEVQKLADKYMTDPYKAFVGTLDLAAVHSVTQLVEFCEEEEKKSMIIDFIHQMDPSDKVIVFVGKKIIADDVSSDLAMDGIMCQCIHGDREQCDREAALSEFKDGTVRILVATDVASRGLDVIDITHVVNYDFPRHIEEYVHRIGRTGRAGRSGTAITFVTRNDWKSAKQLVDIMSEADQEIPDELVSMAERYAAFKRRRDTEGPRGGRGGGFRGGGRGGNRRRDMDDASAGWFLN